MPSHDGYLGVDLGTSGLKLSLLDEHGRLLAESEAPYDVDTDGAGRAEIDPRRWVDALSAAAAALGGRVASGTTVRAVGFAGQMHGLVPVDDEGRPDSPALLWPDRRAGAVMTRWEQLPGEVRGRLANPLVPGMAGPLLTWLAAERPSATRRGFRSPKDWLRSLLTGDELTEPSDASATLLWDVVAGDWCDAALAVAGLERGRMPTLVRSADVVGSTRWPLEVEADGGRPRRQTGGPEGPLVVAGGADAACALTGIRAALPRAGSAVVVNLGTGIQVLRDGARPVARPRPVSHLYADCEGGWYEMQALQNGGLAVSWAQRALGLTWPRLVAEAAESPPGARGARFVPFLTGERGGLAGPRSRGGWSGLTSHVGRPELARSVLEALAFSVRWAVDQVFRAEAREAEAAEEPLEAQEARELQEAPEARAGSRAGGPAVAAAGDRDVDAAVDAWKPDGVGGSEGVGVVLSGGGARDRFVRGLLCDVLGRPVTYVDLRSASAVGAAVLAGRGVGVELNVQSPVIEVPAGASADLSAAYDDWRAAVQLLT